ncbi:MAG: thiamine pyrophosphate-dependent dehydrogenase E1 component subunit alpha [Candidatus Omnitrophica bacterium]|nr:thiamine pyrophosphate-dependent dehydrogenase E1 component subunit alpha [Candidatus Omnitrophota bacterium]
MPIDFESSSRDLAPELSIGLYKTMLRIRLLQSRIREEYPKDEIKTPVHLCVGQEAIPAGVCANLNKEDYVLSNYRGHGHYLAKGGDLKSLLAELYGKKAGCSRGKGGSMHLVDVDAGLLGSSSIVGGGIPVATGAALSASLQETGRVAVTFFGDGAVDEGVLYESINFATLKKLPVIYICENNFYAVCSPQRDRQPLNNIYERFQGCGIPGYKADGNNVAEVYCLSKKVIEEARNGAGPSFVEFQTYRWYGHSGGETDAELGYRSKEELEDWIEKCPVKNFEQFLLGKGLISNEDIARIRAGFMGEIEEAVDFAKASPFPDEKELLDHLYYE